MNIHSIWIIFSSEVVVVCAVLSLQQIFNKLIININPYPPKCWRSWNFFISIIYFTHFGPYINCLKFKIIWTSRIEDMGMCAIAHNVNTRDKSGRFYEVNNTNCIYFHLFQLHNLKFSEYTFCKWIRTRIWSRPCRCPPGWKLNIFAREGQIFPGGRILMFSINLRTTQTFYMTSPTQRGKYLPQKKQLMIRMFLLT